MAGLTIVGIAFESVGLVLAFIGFNKTLSRTSPGKSLVPMVVRRSATFVRERSADVWRRVARRPRNVAIQVGSGVGITSWVGGSVVVYAPLTSVETDPHAFMEQLENKLKDMMGETAKVATRVDQVDQQAIRRAEQISEDVAARFTRLAEEEQRETEHDLVLQFWGWFMVVIGLILGGVSNVI